MRYTNALGLPEAFCNAVTQDDYVGGGDVSMTTLTNPPRQFWLKKRHDPEIIVDVSDRIFSVYGRSVHSIMQKYASKDTITEERLSCDVLGWKLTGQPDLFTETLLQDWKLTSVWVLIYDTNKNEYVWQLNGYRYLAHKNGFDKINKLQNVFLLRDWSQSKAKSDSAYPQKPIEVVDQIVQPYETIEAYLHQRIFLFQGCENVQDGDLPMCTPEERWRKPDTYALKKQSRKSAIKLCKTVAEANELLEQKHGGAETIEFRPGEDLRCARYCDCREFCDYYKSLKPVESEDDNA